MSRRRITVIALGVAAFLALALIDTPLAHHATFGSRPAMTAAVVALMVVWWFGEALPIHVTALVPIIMFPIVAAFPGGFIDNVTASALPYIDAYIFLFAGGMGIAAAMQQSNLHRRLALAILALVGTDPARLLLGVLCATAFLSLWISNTATAAMMMPIGMALIAQLETRGSASQGPDAVASERPRKLMRYGGAIMLAVAYGANVGGIGTKIGTAPNMQLVGFLGQRGVELSFVQYALVGLGFVILFLPITWLVLWRGGRSDAPRGIAGAEAVASERAALGPMKHAEWVVLAVFIAAATLWTVGKPITEFLAPHITAFTLRSAHVEGATAMLAALTLFCVRADGRRVLELASLKSVPWETLLLLGGSFSMAAAVQESGLAGFGARALSEMHTLSLLQQTLIAGFASVFISAFASNTATIGVLLPILWNAVPRETAPTVLFAATIGCSCDFMLPAGTPPNAIVFGSGYLTIPRMAKTGIVLDLLAAVLAALWCALLVPHVLGAD